MRRIVIALLGFGIAASAAAAGHGPGSAPRLERVLTERFGFSAADLGQLRGGQSVTKTAPIEGPEMAVFGAVRIPDDKERLVRWIRDIEGFRKAADVGISRKLGSPPAINDFGDLSLDAGELAAARRNASLATARCASAIGPSRDSRPMWTGAPPTRADGRTC